MDRGCTRLMVWTVVGLAVLLVGGFSLAEARGGKVQKRLPRWEYGTVVLNRFSEANQMAPVVFRHWVHRAKHTCRLCHVDIGFAMEAGGTGIHEEDNRMGLFCGTCHNGKEAFGWETAKGGKTVQNCNRCHAESPVGMDQNLRNEFMQLASTLPRGLLGDGIDWMQAEEQGLIQPKDFIEGVSFPRPKMTHEQGEINLDSKLGGLPDIVFSHKKHAVWNGCEVCHPDLFALKAGTTKFTMQEIFDGLYCGACHGEVAFPLQDCGLCHTKPVTQ